MSKTFTPHHYQKYCINRMISDPELGLFLDMGLGKTVITLTAINDLRYNRFAVRKVLVIAPKKVAEATWSQEAARWDHLKKLRINLILGTATKRIRALNTPGDIWVINRENVPWLVDYTANAWPFDMVVLDELTSFKSPKAKRFKALRNVRWQINRVVGLTGTPAPNGLQDLWAQVYLLDQGKRLYDSYKAYEARYFDYNEYSRSLDIKLGADAAIQDKIRDLCISMKAEDYLDLPECIIDDIPVVLDSKALKAYQQMEKEAILEISSEETITAGTAAVVTGKLLQLCNGAVYTESREVIEIHDSKIEAFMELIEGLNGKPALVFYTFQHDRDRIKVALSKTGLRVRDMKSAEDQLAWNNREVDILLAHPASAGYGLNLQAGGNHAIWFGLNWSLELYQQANKRLHRQGQSQVVIIHRLIVQGGVDEDVAEALEQKGATQDALMQSLQVRIKRLKEADQ